VESQQPVTICTTPQDFLMLKEQYDKVLSYLGDRKKCYQLTFKYDNPAGRQVLEDLATFCRASESCVMPGDHDRTLLLEGRREVWLRIQQHLNLSPEQLAQLFTKG
jgi:UDP-2,3-diacylglucosamine pyrophosphatase LpxH